MTAVTLEEIKAMQAILASKIAALDASVHAPYLLVLPETTIALHPGEHYAGPILDEEGNISHHLVLLAQKPDADMNWDAAKAWASSVGGELPTRREQSLLFANLKSQFEGAYYWSSEAYKDDGAYAWYQDFLSGSQYDTATSYEARVRAVRRVTA